MNIKKGLKENFENLDKFLAKFDEDTRKWRYVSQMEAIDFDPRTDLYSCETIYWVDGDHFSLINGARRFGERIVRHLNIND